MQKSILVALLTFMVSSSSFAQFVEEVQYLLKFNESNCRYEVHLYVETGTVTNAFFKTQASSQISIVTPADASIAIGNRFNPKRVDNGTPNFWNITVYEIAPAVDPGHNYYSITPALSPISRYDDLVEGDTILLFDLVLTNAQHGDDPIRLYENDVDLNAIDGLGGNFNNGMTIGGPAQLYNGNLAQIKPTLYADLDGPSSIFANYTTQLEPVSGGNWINANPAIVSLSPTGVVTGTSAGSADLTFQPTGSSCISHTKVNVIPPSTAGSIGIGIDTPHPSAILDLSSSDKGLLIPRMSALQRMNLASPADGLMVFQNTGTKGFYYYSNNQWRLLMNEVAANSISAGPIASTSLTSKSNEKELAEVLERQAELSKIVSNQTEEISRLLEAGKK